MMTTPSELRELTDETLADRLSEAKQELWKRRLDLATGQLDNTSEVPKYKREIARIQTVMREREIAAHEAQSREQS
jgi:large subunit ribosomal protein L29